MIFQLYPTQQVIAYDNTIVTILVWQPIELRDDFNSLIVFTLAGAKLATLKVHTVYDLYFAVTLIWRFGSVALQPPIIMSANGDCTATLLGAARTVRR